MKFITDTNAINCFGSIRVPPNNLLPRDWAQAQLEAFHKAEEEEWFEPTVIPPPDFILPHQQIPTLETPSRARITPMSESGSSTWPISGFFVDLNRISVEQAGRLLDHSSETPCLILEDGTRSPVHSSNSLLEAHLQESIRRTIREILPQDITDEEKDLLQSLSSSLARRVLTRFKESPGWR